MTINYDQLNDSAWLKDQYLIKKLSTLKIANLCNCSPALVSKKLKFFGIKTRSTSESMKLISKEISENNIKNWKTIKYRNKVTSSIRTTYENEELKQRTKKFSTEYWKNPKSKSKASKHSKKQWKNEEYKKKVINSQKLNWTDKEKQKQSDKTKLLWEQEAYKLNQKQGMAKYFLDPMTQELISARSKKLWKTPKYREKQIEISKQLWKNPKYRAKHATSRVNTCAQSILDTTVISILKRLGYDAKPVSLGPWTFDALVKLDSEKDLLIECQGDYWHSRNERIIRDAQKRTYYDKYLSEQYDLLILWEHEFYSIGRIADILRAATNTTEEINVSFAIKDLEIKLVETNVAIKFLQKYHYMMKHRSGIHYGAYLKDKLVAICSFSSITRKSSATKLKLKPNELIELSRLCIDPSFRKKNLASKLISKSIKNIKKSYPNLKSIITFADTTLGHTGTVYKASNFKYDGDVKPTYWYIDQNGYHRHKKTVWDQAKRLGKKEKTYADECGLIRIDGKKLLRFVFWL